MSKWFTLIVPLLHHNRAGFNGAYLHEAPQMPFLLRDISLVQDTSKRRAFFISPVRAAP